jgi:hypothetical protein
MSSSPPAPNAFASSAPSENLFGDRSFLFYLGARNFSEYSYQIATVAVGWQIYELTGSAFQLGMVGLVQCAAGSARSISYSSMLPTNSVSSRAA